MSKVFYLATILGSQIVDHLKFEYKKNCVQPFFNPRTNT